MQKKPEYITRIKHHAQELQSAFPIVLGFVCGLSEKDPKPQRSTGHFTFQGQKWIVRGAKIRERYNSVELKPYGSESYIRIHYSRLKGKAGREGELIATLVETRRAMQLIANGANLEKVLE
jgi:hypothetical protein